MTDPTTGVRDDGAALRAACASFVRSVVTDADADGVVVELSGGRDSTAVAALAVDALGPYRVYGLVLPSSKLGLRSLQDAEAVAEALGLSLLHI